MMVTSGLNAKRFAGKPLRQPLYQFGKIEKCNKDLSGSRLYEVTNRDDFVDATAEMVLLCNEAMRRSKQTTAKKTSKPLSLEYIADRLDIDDPLHGYFVRDQESRLQGFITCTTFTNWQKTFRWDSIHDSSFSYDEDELSQQMLSGERVHDKDGSLAFELQQSVRCGDPYNEGIVWPRIAEISLLGGLGCGKALLSLAIERLETMKPTASHNYDYAVLQATENSVPFYESMGFIRVGALTVDEHFHKKRKASNNSENSETETDESDTFEAKPEDDSSSVDNAEAETPSEIVSSPYTTYVVETGGESPGDIAKKFNVAVWDIVFLNQYVYNDLTSRSYLKKGTRLFIPSANMAKTDAKSNVQTKADLDGESSAPRWYIAKENDTPKMIARKFGIVCKDLVAANIGRLPELLPISRLKEGTHIKVSHFHIHDDEHVPYCHWTFPDDKFENGEPSYMMVRKLNRVSTKARPVQSSLAVPIAKNMRPPASLFHAVTAPQKTPKKTPTQNKPTQKKPMQKQVTPNSTLHIPGKPKRPLSAYIIFCNEHRDSLNKELAGKPASEYSKVLSVRWKQLGEKQKANYQRKHEAAKHNYEESMRKYEKNLQRFFEKHPEMRPIEEEEEEEAGDEEAEDGDSLYCKVVTVKPGALGDAHKEFKYFYVLTYIPDLVWCHLAPMRQCGFWEEDQPQCMGRPKWMLVDESEGMEVDISASFCEQVASRAVYRTVDADDERWDIFDSGDTKKLSVKPPAKTVAVPDVHTANVGGKKTARAAGKKPAAKNLNVRHTKRRRDDGESACVTPGVLKESPPLKKGKASLTKSEDPEAAEELSSTTGLPRRKSTPISAGIVSEQKEPSSTKRLLVLQRPPAKTLKKRGKVRKNPFPSPARKVAEKKHNPSTRISRSHTFETEQKESKSEIVPSNPAALSDRRDLPRRKAAPTEAGFFSEASPMKKKKTLASGTASVNGRTMVNPDREPTGSGQRSNDSPEKPHETRNKKCAGTKRALSVEGYMSPRKRALSARVATTSFRPLPNRKAAPIFKGAPRQTASLDLTTSPLLMRHRLVA